MKPFFDLVVVIPVGPNTVPEFLRDTIESVRHYAGSRPRIILADDPRSRVGAQLAEKDAGLDVICNERATGKLAGLYFKLCHAFKHAAEHYRFSALLRLDDDALIIGPEPEAKAIELFERDHNVGLAGRYISGRFCVDEWGNLHDNVYARNTLMVGTLSLKMLRRPRANWALRTVLLRAVEHGYEIGENIFGGAYFISPRCIRLLDEAGYLPHPALRGAILEEDHLFSLLACATGMKLADLATSGPFGCAWKGLPASPSELLQADKKIIHSLRGGLQSEEAIRAQFRAYRALPVALLHPPESHHHGR